MAEVSVMEIDKAKPGYSQKLCKFCNRIGHGKNPDEKTRKKLCKAFGTGHFANARTVKKEDAKSNAVAAVEEKEKPKATKAMVRCAGLAILHKLNMA